MKPGESLVATRRVTEPDIPLVRALAERIWREHYPGIITPAQIEYMLPLMYDVAVIREELAAGVVWELIVQEHEAIGFLSYSFEAGTRRVKLSKLYVLPRLHGSGIGRRMLERVKEQAGQLGARQVYLTVNKRNLRAIRAYERAGFRAVEEVVTDIGGGFVMDDFVMAFELGQRRDAS